MALDLSGALNGVRLKCVVDWICFEVRLSRPSQFRHVQDRMVGSFGKVYVEPVGDMSSGTVFRFKVQDPGPPDQFMKDVQCLRRPDEPWIREADITLLAFEVALDGYLEGSDRSKLALTSCYFLNRLVKLPAAHLRLTSPGHFKAPASPRDLHQALMDECSANIGERDAEHRVRAYVKHYDSRNGTRYHQLPVVEHRARLEVTLSGTLMPIRSIDEWRSYRFELLAMYFAMCRPVEVSEHATLLQHRKLLLGRAPDSPKVRPSDRRKRPPASRRDSVTNQKIRDALRALSKRQGCRNSGKNGQAEWSASEGTRLFGEGSPKYFNDVSLSSLGCTDSSREGHQSPMTGSATFTVSPDVEGFTLAAQVAVGACP